MTTRKAGAEGPNRYEIHIRGRLDQRWATSFDGLTLTALADGTTVLEGTLSDQAALHGLLNRLRDLGLPLLSLVRVPPTEQP